MFSSSFKERFFSKIEKNDCWFWRGTLSAKGYGFITKGKQGEGHLLAHRVSWQIHHGDIPDGLYVCHRCDNPQCVNPEHLFLGTPQENMDDMKIKNRGKKIDRMVIARDYGSMSARALAKKHGITHTSVLRIAKEEGWNGGR